MDTGTMRVQSRNCLNSRHVACWLSKKGEDYCQCGFDCKVSVLIESNGHSARPYVVNSKEFRRLKKELTIVQ